MADRISRTHVRGIPVTMSEDAEPVDDLLAAVLGYEAALMADDLPALSAYFAPGDGTLRGDESGLLVGHEAITGFRGRRGGAPKRTLDAIHVRAVSKGHAYVAMVTAPAAGGRGLVTQLWERRDGAWRIAAAHVQSPPRSVDPRIWRVVGDPLQPALRRGSLDGHTIAVKDVFAVEGHAMGAGVRAYLDGAPLARRSAPALDDLRAAGAAVRGIAQTDQFAYSIAGRNADYGTPPNPAVPGAISGGSSSGPAAAVAMGHASIGLATDTAGSIRIPASYQGLWGLRTTHGLVDRTGLLPLATSFDTVGWLTRDGATLAAAARASIHDEDGVFAPRLLVAPALAESASPGVARTFAAVIERLRDDGVEVERIEAPVFSTAALDELAAAFRTVQAAEAWGVHGAWVESHPGALGEDIARRFAWAASVTREAEASARATLAELRRALDAALGGGVLMLPAAASVAPALDADGAEIEQVRTATMRMTAVAGATGRPAISVPGATSENAPVGVCFVGPRGTDLALVDAARAWADLLPRAD